MLCEPVDNPAVLKLATPLTSATGLPKSLPSIWNWIVPGGMLPSVALTVAVTATDWPKAEGLADEDKPVAVAVSAGLSSIFATKASWLAVALWSGKAPVVDPAIKRPAALTATPAADSDRAVPN